jgi:hypothetical protein
VQNDPGKSNFAVPLLLWVFLGDEGMVASPLLGSHDSFSALTKIASALAAPRAHVISMFVSTESMPSDDFDESRELDALKLSTVAKVVDFPLQACNDFTKIWEKAEVIGTNDIDPIQNPQRF